jgi:hypothetical protein
VATVLPRGPFRDETFTAAEALTSYQYHWVRLASATTVEVGSTDETVMGILQNAPASGGQAVVRTAGQSYLMVDGDSVDVAVMDPLDCDSSGHGVKQATNNGWYGGFAREANTGTSKLIVVDVDPGFLANA